MVKQQSMPKHWSTLRPTVISQSRMHRNCNITYHLQCKKINNSFNSTRQYKGTHSVWANTNFTNFSCDRFDDSTKFSVRENQRKRHLGWNTTKEGQTAWRDAGEYLWVTIWSRSVKTVTSSTHDVRLMGFRKVDYIRNPNDAKKMTLMHKFITATVEGFSQVAV